MGIKTDIIKKNYTLHPVMDCDTLSLEDIRKLYTMKENEILLSTYTFPTSPSSDGYYHIYVSDNTKKSGRKQLKDKTLSGLQNKVLLHEKGVSGRTRKTFKDVFELSQQNKLKYIKSDEKKISAENTCIRTNKSYNRFFSGSDFEKKYIDEISHKDIENICFANLEKYDLRKKAFASMRGILKSVFDLAYYEYWITENPYLRVDFKKFRDMLAVETSPQKRVHSSKEVSDILQELHRKEQARPKYSSVWALEMQILMGARRGELPPLTWSDITDTHISITKEQLTHGNEFIVVHHTKNHRDRQFPLTDDLKDFLNRLKAMQDKYYPNSEYLFPADTKSGIITNRAVYLVYQGICQTLGIEIQKDLIRGPHSFRRNAITDVVNATNGNIVLASSLFGNSPEVAKSNYFTGADLSLAKKILDTRNLVTNSNQI